MKPFFLKIISILFPETCIICKKENVSLCQNCIQNFPKAPFIQEPWVYSLFSYQDKHVRSIIHALKFNHTQSIADHLGQHLYELLQSTVSNNLVLKNDSVVTLIPVPRMQSHIKQRGFDDVLALCKSIVEQNKKEFQIENTSIIRVNTKPQVGLSRHERLINMKNAFCIVSKNTLRDRIIYIVDDVMTTGSTLHELRKVCLEAGAKEVYAITVAH